MEYGINHAEELIEAMEIIDLSEDTRVDYFTCLEEWSDEMKDGVCRKVDRNGISVLLLKTVSDETNPPRWIRAKKNRN